MKRIIIDTDPGIDDALAILLAATSKELKIEALTTVSGNVDIENVTKNALTILNICNKNEIPVYKGAVKPLEREHSDAAATHGNNGLGNLLFPISDKQIEEESAVDYLVRMAASNPGEITLMPIGPLTNIALAIKKDKNFADNIKDVVIMGGAEFGGNMSPNAEFNFWHDPEAAKIVFEAGFKDVVMIGLDATRKVILTPAMRELIKQIDTPVSDFIHKITRVYVDGHWVYERVLGCELCDVLVSAYLMDNSVVELKEAYVAIETKGLCEGTSVVYRKEYYPDKTPNCKVAVDAHSEQFFELFMVNLFPEYTNEIKALLKHEYR